MKTNIYNIVILDQSGSMESIKKQSINGYNETVQTIKAAQKKHHETQEHFVTLVVFDSSEIKPFMTVCRVKRRKNLTIKRINPMPVPHCTMLWV